MAPTMIGLSPERGMRDDQSPIKPGATITFAYPFVREKVSLPDSEGSVDTMTWRPGTRCESVPVHDMPDGYDPDTRFVADGMGEQIVTVVSVHQPPRFPSRVFFTRQWKSPAGRTFGKRRLLIQTSGAFRRLVRGYRHEYLLLDNAIEATAPPGPPETPATPMTESAHTHTKAADKNVVQYKASQREI